MRKIILSAPVLLIFILILSYNGFSFSRVKRVSLESHIYPANIDYLRACVFVKLSPKEFGAITGKKYNLPQRIFFKIIQRKLRHG